MPALALLTASALATIALQAPSRAHHEQKATTPAPPRNWPPAVLRTDAGQQGAAISRRAD